MRNLEINLPNNYYEILIKSGIINKMGEEISKIYKGDNIALITDENVNKFYGDIVKRSLEDNDFKVLRVVLKPGEGSKSVESLVGLYNELLDFRLNRGNLIIALGGGVIGDLAGFCAATLLRGIPFVQVPTSLLAQIDSSIGGKVAVDLPRGKNLIGNFYHPKAVYIDPQVLKTLEKRYVNDGLGEAIKYGLIKDRELFEKFESIESYETLFENMEDIIYRCCSIKKHVVEQDEKDNGERMILNFGHTIGHAIEKLQNYKGVSHGEAVTIGMYLISLRCEELNICRDGVSHRIKKLLDKFSLPYSFQGESREDIMDAISVDKKTRGNFINLILIKDIGEVFIYKANHEELEKFI
ncbi:3-dehydroquinate synthase [uncultured Clostridium sp.]|uniref:3-dehydroquinate synthase n=1 Tax=uncultured Clostridium sp. TaxID=59620 RepID=UPI00321694C2